MSLSLQEAKYKGLSPYRGDAFATARAEIEAHAGGATARGMFLD